MKLPYRLLVGITRRLARSSIILSFVLLLGIGGVATASVIGSKHDLSTSGPGPVKATSETQICVFCHTPHGGDQLAGAPLWNRVLSTATYTPYLSSTMDANQPPGEPGASSKVCLSCHDGTLAIGTVGNLNGKTVNIAMSGTTGGFMPDGTLTTGTGYTRNLGIDLSNDHPISITYDTPLSGNDGELRDPATNTTIVGNRSFSVKPIYPLESGQMQCGTCHDPHKSTPKFLRGRRLQEAAPLGGFYVDGRDIMCLACHDKDNAAATWSNSAHANVNVANEAYTNAAADKLEFPHGTPVWQASCLGCHDTHSVPGARRLLREGTSGGNSAIEETCYQCHRAQGGTNNLDPSSPPNTVPDIRSDFVNSTFRMPICCATETHNISGSFNDSNGAGGVGIASGTSGRCKSTPDVGPVGDQCGKDFMESEALLGKQSAGGLITNRHAECTDCHNPHRTTKNRLFNANAATPDAAGTHKHNIAVGDTIAHSNIASGSLRGSFGVEPVYTAADFGTPGIPLTFTVKRGDPGLSGTSNVWDPYVTREYQVCLKCHSNYAYDTPDLLGSAGNPGGTPATTDGLNNNSFYRYLNTAMEFQAPTTPLTNHKGEPASTADSGAYAPTYSAHNYRSWHPVMDNTGRTVGTGNPRGNASPNLWRSPWNGSDTDGPTATLRVTGGAVGNQTMYCSDCHGSVNAITNGVVPDWNGSTSPWGPHGSAENFILKGPSKTTTATAAASDTLCFRCHDATQYADANAVPAVTLNSGFSAAGNDALLVPMTNLHQRHAYYTSTAGRLAYPSTVWVIGADNTYRCTMCHTGTAHGWKNKDFLINLNDVGPELNKADGADLFGGALGGEIPGPLGAGANVPKGTQVPAAMAPVPTGYTNGPYYQGALLRIANTGFPRGFQASGNWTKADCATAGCH